jgi:hypothetical protein
VSLTSAEARTHLRADEVELWDAIMSPDTRFIRAECSIGVVSDRDLRRVTGKDGMNDARRRASLLIGPLARATSTDCTRAFLYRLACARAGVNLWPDEVKP